MKIDTANILTMLGMLTSLSLLVFSFTRKTERNDIKLMHEMEELKSQNSNLTARLEKIETAYSDGRVTNAEIKLKIENIEMTLNNVFKPLIEQLNRGGGL